MWERYARAIAHDCALTPRPGAPLLLVLATYSNPKTGRCRVKRATLQKDTQMSLAVLDQTIAECKALEVVETKRTGRSSFWQLTGNHSTMVTGRELHRRRRQSDRASSDGAELGGKSDLWRAGDRDHWPARDQGSGGPELPRSSS